MDGTGFQRAKGPRQSPAERESPIATSPLGRFLLDTPVPTLIVAGDDRITAVNPAFESLYRGNGTELVGRAFLEFARPVDGDGAGPSDSDPEVGKEIRVFTFRTADGSPLTVRAAVSLATLGEGETARVVQILEVGGSRATEEPPVIESICRTIEELPLAAMVCRSNGAIVAVNGKWRDLTGHVPEEAPTVQRWLAEACPTDAEAKISGFMETMARGGSQILRIALPYGARRSLDIHTRKIDGGTGKDILCLAVDVTERENRERAILRAVDALEEGFSIWDSQDRLLFFNRRYAEQILGTNEALRPGLRFEEFLRIIVEKGLMAKAVGREERWIEDRLHQRRKDRSAFDVEISDGRIIHVREFKTAGGETVLLYNDVTQERIYQRELRESEFRYRALVDTIPDLIYIHVDGRLVFVNPAFVREMGGEKADEFLGRDMKDIIHPDFRDLVARRMHEIIEEGRSVPFVHQCLLRKDGKVIDVEVTGMPFPYEGERAILSIARNISSEIQMQRQLRRSNAVLRLISETMLHFLMGHEPETVLRSLLVGVIELVHGHRAFIVEGTGSDDRMKWRPIAAVATAFGGPGFISCTHGMGDEDIATYARTLTRAAELGNPAILSLREGGGDSLDEACGGAAQVEGPEDAHAESLLSLPLTREADLVGVLAVVGCRDAFDEDLLQSLEPLRNAAAVLVHAIAEASARREAESALRASERYFRAILQNLREGLIVIDGKGTVVHFNTAAETIFGYGADEIRGKNIEVLVPGLFGLSLGEDKEEDGEKPWHSEVMEEGREAMGRRKDGRTLPLRISINEIPPKDVVHAGFNGSRRAFVATIQDLTERKRLEETLRRAQRLDAVGRLTGGIAHDFNNLLGIIIGNLDLLHDDLDDEDASDSVARALRAALRGAELTQRLLAFSRRTGDETQLVNINEFLKDMLILVERTLRGDITLETRFCADPWPIEINGADFENAVLNLVLNARDALPKGGTVTIETANATVDEQFYDTGGNLVPPGQYVVVTVTDTGEGMDEATLSRVFEPFFTTKEGGSGLGLSMVYGFVRRSKGYIVIGTAPGFGCSIRLYLPRARSDAENASQIRRNEDSLPGGSETILLVDDEIDLLNATRKTLTKLGYTVHCTDNYAEACSLIEQLNRVDLLISDIIMPGAHSGYDLAERARARFPEVGILYITGNPEKSGKSEVEGSRENGANAAVLLKPFRISDLARKVRAALDRPADRAVPAIC